MEKASETRLKRVRELMRDKQARDTTGLFPAEGLKIVRDMTAKGHALDFVIVSSGFLRDIGNKSFLHDLGKRGIPLFETGNKNFERMSSLQHSQGILAVAKKPHVPELAGARDKGALLVLCDGIQDPGNLGAIVRTSIAFGANSILLTGENVDVYNPKVVRASSGMILDIPLYRCNTAALDYLRNEGYRLLVSRPRQRNSKDVTELKGYSGPLSILAFGSEGKGVSREISAKADVFFHIPVHAGVESLNVTAAAAISLYLFAR